jgi:hypothetical protein
MSSNPSRLAGQWKVSFEVILKENQVQKQDLQGELHLWAKDWVVLLSDSGTMVAGRHLSNGEWICVGSTFKFPLHSVKVLSCDFCPEFHRSAVEVCVPTAPASSLITLDWRWKVSYSTLKDLDHDCMKSYDGTLQHSSSENWLILKNAKGDPIAIKSSKKPCFQKGDKVQFPLHVVRIGVCLATLITSPLVAVQDQVISENVSPITPPGTSMS